MMEITVLLVSFIAVLSAVFVVEWWINRQFIKGVARLIKVRRKIMQVQGEMLDNLFNLIPQEKATKLREQLCVDITRIYVESEVKLSEIAQ